jgi:hypothetical protein
MPILDELTDGAGYYLGCRLTPAELVRVRDMITRHYLAGMAVLAPALVEEAAVVGIENYHALPLPFDHGSAWRKETRLLPPCDVDDCARMGFCRQIDEQVGPIRISHGELNWRLVRPGQPTDVGPLHLDKWFWDAGYGTMPAGHDRFKIWIAVFCEPGANGLMVKPFSQERRTWKHHFERRDGIRKPVLDENEDELRLQLLPLKPGDMVLFHDRLLHGGAVNRGAKCRVSLELTILFPRVPRAWTTRRLEKRAEARA